MPMARVGRPVTRLPRAADWRRWRAGVSKYRGYYDAVQAVKGRWLPIQFETVREAELFVATAITHRLERYRASRRGALVYVRYDGPRGAKDRRW